METPYTWRPSHASAANAGFGCALVKLRVELPSELADRPSAPERFGLVEDAGLGGARADVGDVFGGQFTNAGFNFLMTGLRPGQYYVGVYAHSTVSGTFNQQRFVLVTIIP